MYLYNFRYSLRGNYIETIPLEPFHVLRQLDRLDLGENFLTSLPPIMFNGTLTINDLNLEYNYIERLEDSAFISLQPRRLYLGHNRISYIDPKTIFFGNRVVTKSAHEASLKIAKELQKMKAFPQRKFTVKA